MNDPSGIEISFSTDVVVVLVSAWGAIDPREYGFRSEYQRIEHLWLGDDPDKYMLSALRERYRVPVTINYPEGVVDYHKREIIMERKTFNVSDFVGGTPCKLENQSANLTSSQPPSPPPSFGHIDQSGWMIPSDLTLNEMLRRAWKYLSEQDNQYR